jgi:hypothetical protein
VVVSNNQFFRKPGFVGPVNPENALRVRFASLHPTPGTVGRAPEADVAGRPGVAQVPDNLVQLGTPDLPFRGRDGLIPRWTDSGRKYFRCGFRGIYS